MGHLLGGSPAPALGLGELEDDNERPADTGIIDGRTQTDLLGRARRICDF
jgi:hypothetical protein